MRSSVSTIMRWSALFLMWASILLSASPIALAQSTQYYVNDGDGFLRQLLGDPEAVTAKFWEVRLYRRGSATGGKNYWGLISDRSADQVMRHLERSQKFEQTYERWCRCETGSDTYFNPMGPIAVVETSRFTNFSSLIDRILTITNRLQVLRDGMAKIDQILNDRVQDKTAFKSVGKVLKEYSENFCDVQKKLFTIQAQLDRNEADFSSSASALRDVQNELEKAISSTNGVQSAVNGLPTRSGMLERAVGTWRGGVDNNSRAELMLRKSSKGLGGTVTYTTRHGVRVEEEVEGEIDPSGNLLLRATSFRVLEGTLPSGGGFALDTFRFSFDQSGRLVGGFADDHGQSGQAFFSR